MVSPSLEEIKEVASSFLDQTEAGAFAFQGQITEGADSYWEILVEGGYQ